MSKLTVKTPTIITLDFQQERGDSDYGTCMWATFRLDTERYEMMIMSDCGNYSYGWHPTPGSESFLHLMSRLDEGYLLDKLSSRTVVDSDATFAAVKEYISEWCDEDDEDRLPDMDDVKVACQNYTEDSVYQALLTEFDCTAMSSCDQYDLLCCIEKDYPTDAKKIVEVFVQNIRPKCRELDGAAHGNDMRMDAGRQRMCSLAADLSEQLTAEPPNDPLTLKELRGMHEEIAWCAELECWGVVVVETGGVWDDMPFLLGHKGCQFMFNIEARKLTLYRRKPDGGGD